MRSATFGACSALLIVLGCLTTAQAQQTADDLVEKIGASRGIVALIEPPAGGEQVVDLARNSELTIYVQTADAQNADKLRRAASAAGLLGTRIFVVADAADALHLADNVADGIVVASSAAGAVNEQELLRALRPRASAIVGDRRLTKPVPAGIDEWTHPYHGPDNNPQSTDQLARGAFQTQFLAEPKFSPMPEQSVIAGGRIYKSLGHIAHKANQNEMLNTLLCVNAYNGTILWKRTNPPGFMIHRNTMIATDDALLMGDHESCKIIDAETGEVRDQITVPKGISDGPVWKWMALKDNVLYALVGNLEVQVDTQKSDRRGLGHWPWGMWEGHDYNDPRTAFGFGRTFVAIDLATKKLLWHYRDEEFLDARGVCMRGDRIYSYSPERFLACIDARDGSLLWKNSDKDLLEAIDANGRAQHYITGYATTCYMKCNDDVVLFAGPQRKRLVAASTKDGKLAWTYDVGNLQLVLRDDALFAAGPQGVDGVKLDYATGEVLASFPARRACTRATGCIDSIFYRANGGTVRVMTETNTAQHIAPMRPPCQDGVLVANGNLYWGPWMCGCQLSLYGNICLSPAVAMSSDPAVIYADALKSSDNLDVQPLGAAATDWISYRGNNARSDVAAVDVPAEINLQWSADICSGELPTAPVAAGGMVFVADRTGAVQAFNKEGRAVWKSYAGGPIYYPPAIAQDRLFVGSADGRVYALEAKTGRQLWSFRVAPADRLIPVYGKLISRWPVAGGVVVENGVVYAAAGLAHYDGTYVVALDAVTGRLKAGNTTSGVVAADVNNGISLQGDLSIVDGELRFLAGGVYETARYNLQTLECLNEPAVQVNSQFRTAFYPYYPEYGKYVSLDYACANGATLCHDASYEGSLFTNLALQEPLPPGVNKPFKEAARWLRRRGEPAPKEIWQDTANRRFTSFIVSGNRLMAAGHPDLAPEQAFLASINIDDGQDAWRQDLPGVPVKGGVAIDGAQRIYVALENGRLLCFAP